MKLVNHSVSPESATMEAGFVNIQEQSNAKSLADLLQEYMTIKQIERDVSHWNRRGSLLQIFCSFFFLHLQKVFADLHVDVRKRVLALKKLQLETIKLDAEFHRGVYDLEQKFQAKHDIFFKQRSDIVNGLYEPSDDECKFSGIGMQSDEPVEGQEKPTGIPNFWLKTLQHVHEVSAMIQQTDEAALKYLVDVRAFSKPAPDLSFQLEFHFLPNKFFKNSVLTKTYLMKCSVDLDDPFSFEGPEIFKSIGCEILWNEGKNVIEMSQKPSVMPFFKNDSFFNFFSPPELKTGLSVENQQIEVRFASNS